MIYCSLGEVFTLRFMTRTSGIRPFWIWRKLSGLSTIESGAVSCHTMHCNQHSTGIGFQLWHHIILIVKSYQFNFIAVILWSPTCISPTGPLRAIKALHLGHSSFFVSPIDYSICVPVHCYPYILVVFIPLLLSCDCGNCWMSIDSLKHKVVEVE